MVFDAKCQLRDVGAEDSTCSADKIKICPEGIRCFHHIADRVTRASAVTVAFRVRNMCEQQQPCKKRAVSHIGGVELFPPTMESDLAPRDEIPSAIEFLEYSLTLRLLITMFQAGTMAGLEPE